MKTKTVTVIIGNSDDKLSQHDWGRFVGHVGAVIAMIPEHTWFFGTPPNYATHQNAGWVVALDVTRELEFKRKLRAAAREFKQDSIAFVGGRFELIKPSK